MSGAETVFVTETGNRWHRDRDCPCLAHAGPLSRVTVEEAERNIPRRVKCDRCGHVVPTL